MNSNIPRASTRTKVPVFSNEEQEEFDRLLQEKDMSNLALFLNYHINEEASIETMVKGVQTYMPYMRLSLEEQDINALLRVLGDASILGLHLEQAVSYYTEAEDTERIQQAKQIGLLYGKWNAIKQIQDYATKKTRPDLKLSDRAYKEFIRSKAIPLIELHRDEDGFYIEEQDIEQIIKEIQPTTDSGHGTRDLRQGKSDSGLETRDAGLEKPIIETITEDTTLKETIFKEALETLEKNGSLNTAKKYIFAILTQDPEIIARHEKKFQQKSQGPRPICEKKLEDYLGDEGKILRTLQNGDKDNYFPKSGNIFLVQEGTKVYVAKEHLKQYTDFSKTNGYSTEKEILEALSKQQHQGIPTYQGTIQLEGIEFLKMEFVKGEPLRRYIKQRLPQEKIIDILVQTATTIEYLHTHNILYGDVKDKNVIYDGTTGKTTIIDFGMSRKFETPITDETYHYSTASTPKYMTPERIMTHKIYARSDVFQLGILAYELLTGLHPFARYDFKEGKWNRESALIKYGLSNLHNKFEPTPEIRADVELCSLLENMLEKEVHKRPHMNEVRERLEKISERYTRGGEENGTNGEHGNPQNIKYNGTNERDIHRKIPTILESTP